MRIAAECGYVLISPQEFPSAEAPGLSVFATNVGTALWTVTVAGTYWLRVRYEQTDFTSSGYASDTGTAITVS